MAKPLVSSVNPLLLSSLVYLIAAAALTPLAKTKLESVKRKDYFLILIVSLSGAVIAPSLFFLGLQHTTASDTAIATDE